MRPPSYSIAGRFFEQSFTQVSGMVTLKGSSFWLPHGLERDWRWEAGEQKDAVIQVKG